MPLSDSFKFQDIWLNINTDWACAKISLTKQIRDILGGLYNHTNEIQLWVWAQLNPLLTLYNAHFVFWFRYRFLYYKIEYSCEECVHCLNHLKKMTPRKLRIWKWSDENCGNKNEVTKIVDINSWHGIQLKIQFRLNILDMPFY